MGRVFFISFFLDIFIDIYVLIIRTKDIALEDANQSTFMLERKDITELDGVFIKQIFFNLVAN